MKTFSFSKTVLAIGLTAGISALSGCGEQSPQTASTSANNVPLVAPGAPGNKSTWAYSGKTGVGTSYEQYLGKEYSDNATTGTVSKVWFSLAQGIITETMFGMIHEAQLKEMQFLIQGDGYLDNEKDDTISSIEYLHTDDQGRPLSLAYKVINQAKNGHYEIEKHIFTDPDQQSLFVRAFVRAKKGSVTPYLIANPHVNNRGSNDTAIASEDALIAYDGDNFLTIKSAQTFAKTSAGFVGHSDGLTDLTDNGTMNWQYQSTGETKGNVALTAKLPEVSSEQVFDLVIGFGDSQQASSAAADNTLARGYDSVLAHYNGEGEHIGWQDYLAELPALEKMREQTTDNGKLLHASAMVLKALEDKTYAGALIASLSNPWGDTVSAEQSNVGYKAVWPRDFYQCAMAFLALGDTQTPLIAFEYLEQVQVDNFKENKGAGGWFLQKTHVDGTLEWVGVQLDQTAMPLMLAWKLWQQGVIDDERLSHWYQKMLKGAADFLVDGGMVDIDWNNTQITPPYTQQERWEEQPGYSPSTTAAVIAGLVAVADIAKASGDLTNAERYLATAKKYSDSVEKQMFTTNGVHGDGNYFIRISQSDNPNDDGKVNANNGKLSFDKKAIIDGGFLELVRYGVRAANDEQILATLPVYDSQQLEDNLKVKYNFTFAGESGEFPGWRRYGNDGYGEDAETSLGYAATGKNTLAQRGRVWPFFTGERGHYELALAKQTNTLDSNKTEQLKATYVKAMELFANEGLMLPEQVFDGVGANDKYQYQLGQGTNSATPLAWTHAEYIKLIRSLSEQTVWDHYPNVSAQLSK